VTPTRAISAILPLALLACRLAAVPAPARSPSSIPLTVQETAGVAREGEVVANGIPLPRSLDLRDPARLAVVDPAGRPVPAQFDVLARWNAGREDGRAPIEWLLVAFPATVAANQSARYRLVTDGSAGPNPPPPHPLRLSRQGEAVTIDTGAAIFHLGAEPGALFDEVDRKEGTRLVAGSRMSARVKGTAHGHSGRRGLSIERQGPLLAAVVVRGSYDMPPVGAPQKGGAGGLGSLRRYLFTAGSPTAIVRQAVAWEGNLACNGCLVAKDGTPNGLLLSGVRDELRLELGGEGTTNVTAVGARNAPAVERAIAAGPAGEEAAVRQLLRPERSARLRFAVAAGKARAEGEKADGGMLAASGPKGTIAVALNHMHRYEPQALRLLPEGALAIDLADDRVWLAHHQGMFATFAVAALPPRPSRSELDRRLWAPLNRPLRAWPEPAWFAGSEAVEELPAGRLPRRFAGYDDLIKGVLQATLRHVDSEGIAGLMTFGVYPRYWGQWKSPELSCQRDPTPGEHWDDTFWCATWTDYHNTLATAPLWAMRSGEVSWLDEVGFPGALRTLHTQIMQCAPGDRWFYCGQAPAGYGGYRADFNSSHAYFDNLFLYYWLTGDSTVVETLRRGGESMRRHMCDLRGPEEAETVTRGTGPAGPACPPDRPNPKASFNGRVAAQWLAIFRFLGEAGPDPSFLEDFRSGLARAVTQQYVDVVRDGRSYGFLGETVKGPGPFTTNQLWQTGLFDAALLHRFALDSGDEPIGSPPLRPSRVLAALARTMAEIAPRVKGDGSPEGHWPLKLTVTWEGERIGGRLVSVAPAERDLYGPEKATLADLVVRAGEATGDPGLVKAGRNLVDFTLRAASGEMLPLGKLDGQYLSRLHAAVADLAGLRSTGRTPAK
jgi:hypothetical protein